MFIGSLVTKICFSLGCTWRKPLHMEGSCQNEAGVAQSVECLTTDWTTGRLGFDPWVLSPVVKRGRCVILTTYPRLVLRSRKSRSYTSSLPQASS
jgi:hypothetical protein